MTDDEFEDRRQLFVAAFAAGGLQAEAALAQADIVMDDIAERQIEAEYRATS